jgi:hypothetical protein
MSTGMDHERRARLALGRDGRAQHPQGLAAVPWRPEDTPLRKVAQLRIPRCDLDDPQSRELSEKIDKLSFSPWHATEDHKPLGNVMRARRVAYEASAALRGQRPEPTAIPI